jgi:hypothetical protein
VLLEAAYRQQRDGRAPVGLVFRRRHGDQINQRSGPLALPGRVQQASDPVA